MLTGGVPRGPVRPSEPDNCSSIGLRIVRLPEKPGLALQAGRGQKAAWHPTFVLLPQRKRSCEAAAVQVEAPLEASFSYGRLVQSPSWTGEEVPVEIFRVAPYLS